jgi:hypothetical protein
MESILRKENTYYPGLKSITKCALRFLDMVMFIFLYMIKFQIKQENIFQ